MMFGLCTTAIIVLGEAFSQSDAVANENVAVGLLFAGMAWSIMSVGFVYRYFVTPKKRRHPAGRVRAGVDGGSAGRAREQQRMRIFAAICLSIASAAGVSGSHASAANAPNACGMLTAGQLHSWFGKEMVPQPTPGMPQAQGCQWAPKDGSQGALTLTIGPARYYVAPSLAAGFKRLSGIGEKAYIVPSLGGWEAGAVKGSKVIGIRTPAMSQSVAVTVLKTLVAKL